MRIISLTIEFFTSLRSNFETKSFISLFVKYLGQKNYKPLLLIVSFIYFRIVDVLSFKMDLFGYLCYKISINSEYIVVNPRLIAINGGYIILVILHFYWVFNGCKSPMKTSLVTNDPNSSSLSSNISDKLIITFV